MYVQLDTRYSEQLFDLCCFEISHNTTYRQTSIVTSIWQPNQYKYNMHVDEYIHFAYTQTAVSKSGNYQVLASAQACLHPLSYTPTCPGILLEHPIWLSH